MIYLSRYDYYNNNTYTSQYIPIRVLHHKNSINNEKNINSNLKVSYETQIQKLNKTNDELNMKLEEHSTTNNDLQVKYMNYIKDILI